jgi:hypothetical protein
VLSWPGGRENDFREESMPVVMRPDAEIYDEVHGSAYPRLLFGPGGLRSELAFWRTSPSHPAAPPPRMNPMADVAGLTEDVIRTFGHDMVGGDFVFSVSRDFVSRCHTLLVRQPGSDRPHPAETGVEVARPAPDLEIQKDWRGPMHLAESIRRVTEFRARHTPGS